MGYYDTLIAAERWLIQIIFRNERRIIMTNKNKIKKMTITAGLAIMLAAGTISGCTGSQANTSSSVAMSSSGERGSHGSKDGSRPDGSGENKGGPGGPGGGSSTANVTYTGATTFSTDETKTGEKYESTADSQQALLASGGTSTVGNATVTKTGDADGDEADFYGTNAAVLAYNGATLNINSGNISTDGKHANAVFAYNEGTINIKDSTISTENDCSGGIMVTGGGTLTAENLTVTTKGRSSAAIRSDRGGGTMTINGGSYTTNGVGSPAVYSTADITVNNATLTSNTSEGLIVEGKNSITINNTTVKDNNTKLNSNSGTFKNVFLYQSMSGDADEGTASFTAKDSTLITENGDTIFVTNTTAKIYLENNTISNTVGDFLRIEAGKWGKDGSNGGNVTLEMNNQKVEGSVIVDSISTLDIALKNNSTLKGAIDSANQAKEIKLSLSKDSTLELTADSYVDSLENEASDNSNIKGNGYKLYVNGTAVKTN